MVALLSRLVEWTIILLFDISHSSVVERGGRSDAGSTLTSSKNEKEVGYLLCVCLCMCVCVCGWGGGWLGECVRACSGLF